MIKISAVSYNNQRALEPLSAVFGRESATLGRSNENFFVLPDAKHLVSRVQASIKSDGQQHTIVSLSRANPVVLNGAELEFEREYELKPGDEMQVGPYVLMAETHLAPVTELPASSTNAAPAASAGTSMPSSNKDEAATPPDLQTLLDAFLRGAGIAQLGITTTLNVEFMESIGKLLAATIDGTFNLVETRALSKREANADVTMVVVRNNNPLKFLPDSQAVLMQMLRKKMPGFMGPVEAVQDAFADLNAHQKGSAAGMHGVVEALLSALDPKAIEQATSAPTFIEGLIPAKRSERMWQQSQLVYKQVCRQARNDFQKQFGGAFVTAYAAEIERLKDANAHD